MGVGGYHLGNASSAQAAIRIVHEATDAGITFMDNAWEYHDGESERRMGRAIADRRDRVFLMTKVCTHGRNAKVALRQLDESLKRLRTERWCSMSTAPSSTATLHTQKPGCGR